MSRTLDTKYVSPIVLPLLISLHYFSSLFSIFCFTLVALSSLEVWALFHKPILFCLYRLTKDCKLPACLLALWRPCLWKLASLQLRKTKTLLWFSLQVKGKCRSRIYQSAGRKFLSEARNQASGQLLHPLKLETDIGLSSENIGFG